MADLELDLSDGALRLLPVTPAHYEFLYWLSVSDFSALRWRYRGQLPPFEVFVQQLHSDVLTHFVVWDEARESLSGYCVAYAADLRNRHCYIGVLVDLKVVGHGVGSAAMNLLVTYLFRTWDFHKVFAEVPAFTLEDMHGKLARLAEITSRFEIEAKVTEYFFYDGQMWDMYIVSATASNWRLRS